MSLKRSYNIEDLRRLARRRLPAPMFHYIDGGADDEWSLRRNTQAFDDYHLLPAYLRDVRQISTHVRVLGCDLDVPFFLAPTGMSRLFHHHKELGVARAAANYGTLYSLSTLGTTSLEEVAAATTGPKMFQIYILKDRGLTRELVERCKAAGYDALCLTIDTLVSGNREREKRYGMSMPPRMTWRTALSFATSFRWLFHVMRQPDFRMANVAHRVDALNGGAMAMVDYVNSQFDRSLTWDDAAWLAELWGGPFAIKGMSTPQDARHAVAAGATAAMLSNHGGRQLEGTPAPVDCVRPVRDAVGDELELVVDGGVRRGTHILKALALGADACSIGRPYLYGLAAGGQAGVERVLQLLTEEVERGMALMGCRSILDIGTNNAIKGRSF